MSDAKAAPVEVSFEPMQREDLEWVASQDKVLYPFPWTTGNFADSMEAGYSCWRMSEGGVSVGYAVLMMVIDEAHILNISVTRACQGRGLGRRLLDHLARVAWQAGARQLLLEVRPSNAAALALYETRGFAVIGRRKGYYPTPGGREDAIVMRLTLEDGIDDATA
ncbi:MAG: ribosomal protein S18-alanine N-acetyltransferase [Proteobacteria bacterium]|nr:ribosomal protein S18-alanine N-acetyltransferase [Pseudomonadota bacterium]